MNATWVGPHLGHDISILELEKEVDLNVYTPACLAEAADFHTYYGKMVTAAGWGSNGTHILDTPHEVEVTVFDCKLTNTTIVDSGFNPVHNRRKWKWKCKRNLVR